MRGRESVWAVTLCGLALSSFPTLKLLQAEPEAFRALHTFHRAAQDDELDSDVIAAVRDRLRLL